jgi:hypothetical protein
MHIEGSIVSLTPTVVTEKIPTINPSSTLNMTTVHEDSAQKDGELDDLISAIKTGKAFFQGFLPSRRQRSKNPAVPEQSATSTSPKHSRKNTSNRV